MKGTNPNPKPYVTGPGQEAHVASMLDGYFLVQVPAVEIGLIPCPHGEGDVVAVVVSSSPLYFRQTFKGAGRGRWWRVIGVVWGIATPPTLG